MERLACRFRPLPLRSVCLVLVVVLLAPVSARCADSDLPRSDPLNARIDQLEKTLQTVIEENRRLADEVSALRTHSDRSVPGMPPPGTAAVPSNWPNQPPTTPRCVSTKTASTPYRVGYDNGFVIRPENPKKSPYSLKINNQTSFRHTGFARGESSWTDSSGNVNSIFNSDALMIPRGRLIFSGNAFLPNMSYLLNLDYNTVSSNPIGFRAYALSYRFSRAFEIHVGQNKVPGSREWLASSWDAQEGTDRSMATTFFRPSLSQGIWLTGQPLDGVYYHAMLSNGFNTINVTPNQLDSRVCCSESIWWEPWGDFGRGYSDLQAHDEAVIRLGASFTYSNDEASQGSDYPENSAVRLSDGTLITQLGAFAPGVTLEGFVLSLGAIDLAYKYNGLSLSTELYGQELSSLRGNGALPVNSVQAYGGVVQGGYFVLPQKVEFYSRYSFVTGHYGSGTETGGGFNWFLLPGKSNLRFTFDTAWLESSPADQNRTGFVAGQTGVLFRTQIAASF